MKLALSLLLLLAALSACNTTEGIGEDLGAAGRAISTGAQKTKDAMNR